MTIMLKVNCYSSSSPSRSSPSSSGYKPRSAPLDPPDGEWNTHMSPSGLLLLLRMCFRRLLTKLLSSFLMVDPPHRALTPSTATARRNFDSGCPLCSRSSFITAPTTSLLLFIRLIPYSRGREEEESKITDQTSGRWAINVSSQVTHFFFYRYKSSHYQCFPI